MIRYIENHDERRAASRVFEKASPGDTGLGSFEAGLVAATSLFFSTKAPVLLYAGQELGEQAEGATGYSGDDGRSSIFDYISPPTLRALHTAGYDVTKLDATMRSRVSRYISLGALIHSPELERGEVFELNERNRTNPAFGDHGRSAYACARALTERSGRLVLLVSNFSTERRFEARVYLSDAALASLGIAHDHDTRNVLTRTLISSTGPQDVSLYAGALRDAGIPVSLGPLDFAVFSVEVS
ncbi:MAG: hypothetical protein U0165_08605 [Polyangiaceae bacterium]